MSCVLWKGTEEVMREVPPYCSTNGQNLQKTWVTITFKTMNFDSSTECALAFARMRLRSSLLRHLERRSTWSRTMWSTLDLTLVLPSAYITLEPHDCSMGNRTVFKFFRLAMEICRTSKQTEEQIEVRVFVSKRLSKGLNTISLPLNRQVIS